MASQNTQYVETIEFPEDLDNMYNDFPIYDNTETSVPTMSLKDEYFIQQAMGLLGTLESQPNEFGFYDQPSTPFEAHFGTPYESPYSDCFPTPIIGPQSSPLFTPFETPFEDFEQDPLLSPVCFFKDGEKDEGYGTTEYNRVYSPDRFDGNPSTLLHTPEKPIFEPEYDTDESPGNLIEPLPTAFLGETTLNRPESLKRKRVTVTVPDLYSRRFHCTHDGCDKMFARLFNLNTHMKTHDPNREKPFICNEYECTKSFARKHDLSRHTASVHRGERLFTCVKCRKPFSRKDALHRHISVKGCPGPSSHDSSPSDSDMSSPDI